MKKPYTVISILITISIFITLSALTFSSCKPKTDNAVHFGAILSLTGAAAPYGQDNLRGLQLAEEVLNERGGVRGKKDSEMLAIVLLKFDRYDRALRSGGHAIGQPKVVEHDQGSRIRAAIERSDSRGAEHHRALGRSVVDFGKCVRRHAEGRDGGEHDGDEPCRASRVVGVRANRASAHRAPLATSHCDWADPHSSRLSAAPRTHEQA